MDHKTKITGFDSLEALAEEIGNLRYDALKEFFSKLSDKMMNDCSADNTRGRHRLANNLEAIAYYLNYSSEHAEAAWKICEPHMKNKENG